MPDWLARLFLALLAAFLRVSIYPLAKLHGYQRFEPDPDTVLVSCCTNGLGHVHQLERVLTVLQARVLHLHPCPPRRAAPRSEPVPPMRLRRTPASSSR